MDRAEKREQVDFLGDVFTSSGSVVVTRYSGLTVAEMTDLRRQMREAGAAFKVIKNRLARIALDNAEKGSASDMFVGPVGIAYGHDPVSAPKVVTAYAKKNGKLVIVGGLLGDATVDEKGIAALAAMPPIEELRAKLLGVLLQPGTNLARVLNAPGTELVRQLNAPAHNLVGVLRAYQAEQEAA